MSAAISVFKLSVQNVHLRAGFTLNRALFGKNVGAPGPLIQQESRAVAMKPRDATAVLFGLKFADTTLHV